MVAYCCSCCCWRVATGSSCRNVAAAWPDGSLVDDVDDVAAVAVAAAGGWRKVPPVGTRPETDVTLEWHEGFSRMSPDRGYSATHRCTLGQPISGHRERARWQGVSKCYLSFSFFPFVSICFLGFFFFFFFLFASRLENCLASAGS